MNFILGAAKWNQAYTAPASYVGKFCQLVHTLGNSTTKVLGAAPYTVQLLSSLMYTKCVIILTQFGGLSEVCNRKLHK